jgi:hypothetical protein
MNNPSRIPAMLLLVVVSTGALAAESGSQPVATLQSPELIQIMALDGEEHAGGLFGSRVLKLPLTPGEHVVTVRYNQLFPLGSDDHDILKSPPIAFRFKADAGQNYVFTVTPPKRYEAAKLFAKNPDIRLVESVSGQSITGVLIKSLGQASLVDTIGRSFQSAEPTALTTLDELKELWGKATTAERAAFTSWQATQAPGK